MSIKIEKNTKRKLEEIAMRKMVPVETRGGLDLHMNGSDWLNGIGVRSIQAALEEAYKLGRREEAQEAARKAKKAQERKAYRLEELTGEAYTTAVRNAAREINEAFGTIEAYRLDPRDPGAVEDAVRDYNFYFDCNGEIVTNWRAET